MASLASHFNLGKEQHRALADCYMTYDVICRIGGVLLFDKGHISPMSISQLPSNSAAADPDFHVACKASEELTPEVIALQESQPEPEMENCEPGMQNKITNDQVRNSTSVSLSKDLTEEQRMIIQHNKAIAIERRRLRKQLEFENRYITSATGSTSRGGNAHVHSYNKHVEALE